MNLRIVLAATVAVAAIGGAAYYFGQERKALQSEAFQSVALTPGLDERINAVDDVRLESQEGGVVTLKRDDAGWKVTSHHGYPAHAERVTALLKRVATLTAIEPKTAKPENHKRLNLNDPAEEDSLGTHITLKAGADVAADIVVGLNRPELQGGGAFVRRWGEDQTWLTEEDFKPRRRTLDLLNRDVVNVDGRRMRSVSIERPAGASGEAQAPIVIVKSAPDAEAYTLETVPPEGFKAKEDQELSTYVRVPDFLIFEDVQPATNVAMDAAVVSAFETFDGLKLVISAQTQVDGETWATMTASTADRSDGLDAFVEANKGQDSESGRIADEFKTPDEVAVEIERWSKNAAGWAYKLTDYKTKRVTATLDDVVEKAPEPEEVSGEKKPE